MTIKSRLNQYGTLQAVEFDEVTSTNTTKVGVNNNGVFYSSEFNENVNVQNYSNIYEAYDIENDLIAQPFFGQGIYYNGGELTTNTYSAYDPVSAEIAMPLYGPGKGTYMRHSVDNKCIVYNEIDEITDLYQRGIVTSGLVLDFDAANLYSYDGNENLVTYSESIGGPVGYLSTNFATINTTQTTDPNGTYTATLINQSGSVNNYVYSQSTTLTINTTYTYSIFIKRGTSPDFQITIDENGFGGKRYYALFNYNTETITTGITGNTANDGVVVGSSYVKYSDGWYRLSLTFTTSSNNVSTFVDMISRFSGPGIHYVWGRQLERGVFTNSYYPTTSNAKIRGIQCNDLSGKNNNGIINGVSYSNVNIPNFIFDGSDNIDCGLSSFQPSQITLCAWVKHENTSDGGIIVKGDVNEATEWGISFGYNSPHYLVGRATTFNNQLVYPWTGSLLSGFHYVCYTMINNVNAKLFVDGNLVASTNTIGSIGLNTKNVLIGKWNNYASLNGNIAQVSIYNRALTEIEIQQNYNSLRHRFAI